MPIKTGPGTACRGLFASFGRTLGEQLGIAAVDGQGAQRSGDQNGDDRHGEYDLSAAQAHS